MEKLRNKWNAVEYLTKIEDKENKLYYKIIHLSDYFVFL